MTYTELSPRLRALDCVLKRQAKGSHVSGRSLMNLFLTHPPLEMRIARLRAMRV